MNLLQRRIWPLMPIGAIAAAVSIVWANPSEAGSLHEAFIAENNTAMDKMMSAMAIKPSGDVDRDFAAMMIPHHQGAIEMAQAELRYGSNEQLRRIAQEIIVDQQQEIAAMDLALDHPLPPSVAAPTQASSINPAPAAEGGIQASCRVKVVNYAASLRVSGSFSFGVSGLRLT